MRFIGWLIKLILLSVVLLIIAAGVLFYTLDAKQIQHIVSQQVKEKTGLVLKFTGDTKLSFYPKINLQANDMALYQADGSTPIAGIQYGQLSVATLPLFKKQVKADGVELEGMYLKYSVNKRGRSNIDPIVQLFTGKPAPTTDAETIMQNLSDEVSSDWSLAEISIPNISLKKSVIEYKDVRSAQDISFAIDHFLISQIDLQEKQASITTDVMFDDNHGEPINFNGQFEVAIEDRNSRFAMRNLDGVVKSARIPYGDQQISLSAPRVIWQQDAQKLQAQNLRFSGNGFTGELSAAAQLAKQLNWEATVQLEPFALSKINNTFNLGLDLQKDANIKINTVTLRGNSKSLAAKNISMRVDDSTVTGNFQQNLSNGLSNIDIKVDRLNLDTYLPASDNSSEIDTTASILPVGTLRELKIKGNVAVANLAYQGNLLQDIRCELNPGMSADKNVFTCHFSAQDRQLEVRLASHVSGPKPIVGVDAKIIHVPITKLLETTDARGIISGSVAGAIKLRLNGDSIHQWQKTADGNFNFDLDSGVLHGINVNNLIHDAVGASNINNLNLILNLTGNELPRELNDNTEFTDTKIQGNIENGMIVMNNIRVATVNGDSIAGVGRIRLSDLAVDMRFNVRLRALRKNKYLQGYDWPVTCNGSLRTQSVTDICGGAIGNLKTVVAEALKRKVTQEAEDLAKQKIEELTGINMEGKSIEQAVVEKAEEKVAEEVQKLDTKINDKLDKQKQKITKQLEEKIKDDLGSSLLKGLFGN